MPTSITSSEKEFVNFAYMLVRNIECIWAERIEHTLDIKKHIFKMTIDNYIICSKNGLGYIFSEGGIAGIWAYACEDLTIEAVQPKC